MICDRLAFQLLSIRQSLDTTGYVSVSVTMTQIQSTDQHIDQWIYNNTILEYNLERELLDYNRLEYIRYN